MNGQDQRRVAEEPPLSLAWLVEALSIVRQVYKLNDGYNPSTLAALHWGERAVQRIAELEAENAVLRSRLAGSESRPPSCFDHSISTFVGAPLTCTLPVGHAGAHRDDQGAEWSPRMDLGEAPAKPVTQDPDVS